MLRQSRGFWLFYLVVVVVLTGLPAVAFSKPQATCPYDGAEIDRAVFTDVGDKRVYFCSAGCREAFLADPQKYLAKLTADGVELETCTTDPAPPAEPSRVSSRPKLAEAIRGPSGPDACSATCDAPSCGCSEGKACGCKEQEGGNDCRQAFVSAQRVCECEW